MLALLCLAGFLGFLLADGFGKSSEPPATDLSPSSAPEMSVRETVMLNREQEEFALAQMRGLLGTVAQLDEAEFATAWTVLQRLAAEQSPGRQVRHPEGFHEALPKGFRSMSKQMRMGFKEMAEAADNNDQDRYRAAKVRVLNTCLACHQSYRFDSR